MRRIGICALHVAPMYFGPITLRCRSSRKRRAPIGRRARRALFAAGLACVALCGIADAAGAAACTPRHFRAPFLVKTMGACGFDQQTLSYQGEPAEQAKCLMRGLDATRNLAPVLDSLPDALASRVGQDTGLPSRDVLSRYLSKQNLDWDFAAHLWQPVSHGNNNDPDAPAARYFVIHDTSGPNYGHRAFPDDIDSGSKINNLKNFACPDGWGKAHVVVNRTGEMLLNHEFGIPWRETKFELAANFSGALKGLYLHVELIQPRRNGGHGWHNDAGSPNPAFTQAQYDRLAVLYAIASVRAERWLIPAFHAAIDGDILNGHDDPLHFDVDSFASSVGTLIETLQKPASEDETAGAAAAPAAAPTVAPLPAPIADGEASAEPAAEAPSAPGAVAPSTPTAPQPGIAPATAAVTPEPAATKPAAPGPAAPDGIAGSSARAEQSADDSRKPGNEAKTENSHERETVTIEHCTTRVFKGRRRQFCRTDVVERRSRREGAAAVRSVDRHVSRQSNGARRHGGDVRTRAARNTSRHGRA
jgi:hypothetical protein